MVAETRRWEQELGDGSRNQEIGAETRRWEQELGDGSRN
jgi:hypothetical protein